MRIYSVVKFFDLKYETYEITKWNKIGKNIHSILASLQSTNYKIITTLAVLNKYIFYI